MRPKQGVVQVCYVVRDVFAAAATHSRLYGSGPFFAAERLPTGDVLHRGEMRAFAPDVALGQWGDVMVELVADNHPGPSIFKDLFPNGSDGGFHHYCLHVENLPATVAKFEASGQPVAFRQVMGGGTNVVMFDTVRTLGHFVEASERTAEIGKLYDLVRDQAENFDGTDPVRPLKDLLVAGGYIPG